MLFSVEQVFKWGGTKYELPSKRLRGRLVCQIKSLTGLYSRQNFAKQFLGLMNKKNDKFLIF